MHEDYIDIEYGEIAAWVADRSGRQSRVDDFAWRAESRAREIVAQEVRRRDLQQRA
jgi:hypothetical protein